VNGAGALDWDVMWGNGADSRPHYYKPLPQLGKLGNPQT